MSELSLKEVKAMVAASKGGGAVVPTGFPWPTPPFAAYAPTVAASEPEACEIEGLNGSVRKGMLVSLHPESGVALVQVQPSQTTMKLRFSQFKRLTLSTPLPALTPAKGDPHAQMLGHRPEIEYRLTWADDTATNGMTVGDVEIDGGLFLFIPQGIDGAVQRIFIPREAYSSVDLGPRIGDMLAEHSIATSQQIEEIAQEQHRLRSQKLGDLLVTDKIVDASQLLSAVESQANMPMVRIGEALLALGMVTEAQLEDALIKQKSERNTPLGELLVTQGLITRSDLQSALARKMGYPHVDVKNFVPEAEAVLKLPFSLAQRLSVLPLLMRDGRLIVAMADPTRRKDIDEIEFACQVKVVPALCNASNLQRALAAAYEKYGADKGGRQVEDPDADLAFEGDSAGKLLESLEQQQADEEQEGGERQIEQSDNSLVRLINTMIIDAHQQKVSDIHIETQPGRAKIGIRFRRDGVLKPYLELPHTYRSALIARIKIMCDLDISERRKPQDGKINFAKFSPQHKLELRVATIPTNNSLEDVVMRLLASAKPLPMAEIGLSQSNFDRLEKAIRRPYGMVLCVGPTGSGKTTTLHSALGHINKPDRKIWTAEDPVEITQKGLRQVQINPKIGWTFAHALRAFLRADPDVIMVGEIRDEETASTAVEASLTGHLVLSTLHTNSAPETITRLLDMGMDPFNFGDSLLAVLAQRLVRRICSKCRTERDATDAEAEELLSDYMHVFPADARPDEQEILKGWLSVYGKKGKLQHYHAPGCAVCEDSGLKGRAGLHELLTVSKPMRRLIQTGGRVEEMQAVALGDGMRTLRQDGITKVLMGITTIEEVRATSNA